jgi:hypothetical protein
MFILVWYLRHLIKSSKFASLIQPTLESIVAGSQTGKSIKDKTAVAVIPIMRLNEPEWRAGDTSEEIHLEPVRTYNL